MSDHVPKPGELYGKLHIGPGLIFFGEQRAVAALLAPIIYKFLKRRRALLLDRPCSVCLLWSSEPVCGPACSYHIQFFERKASSILLDRHCSVCVFCGAASLCGPACNIFTCVSGFVRDNRDGDGSKARDI